MRSKDNVVVTATIPPEASRAIEQIAAATYSSRAAVVRQLVCEALAKRGSNNAQS